MSAHCLVEKLKNIYPPPPICPIWPTFLGGDVCPTCGPKPNNTAPSARTTCPRLAARPFAWFRVMSSADMARHRALDASSSATSACKTRLAVCPPAKSVTVWWFNGKPTSWQKVKVLTSFGKMHQEKREHVPCSGSTFFVELVPVCVVGLKGKAAKGKPHRVFLGVFFSFCLR